MFLGLDLRGGVYFEMQVDKEAALAKRFEATAEDMRVLLRDNRIRYTSVEPRKATPWSHPQPRRQDPTKRRAAIQKNLARDMPTYQRRMPSPTPSHGHRCASRSADEMVDKMLTDAVEQNIGTLNNRVNELGVAEPIIQRQGADRVVSAVAGRAGHRAGQAHPRRHRDARIPRRGRRQCHRCARVPATSRRKARLYNSKELGADGKPIPVLLNKRIIASGEHAADARKLALRFAVRHPGGAACA
jgi:preprotein translocase subunit SecD